MEEKTDMTISLRLVVERAIETYRLASAETCYKSY